MQPLPIIFIHKGDSFYLKYALLNAKKFNPKSRIILLGQNVTKYPDFVEYFPISSYDKSASDFRKVYRHMSIVPEEIERFCFERWFYLDEFLTKNRIRQCLTLDSDVLIYEDVSFGIKKFRGFDFTLANKSSGGFVFVNNPNSISDLTRFIKKCYTDKRLLAGILRQWEELRARNGGGINDVRVLSLYYQSNRSKIGEITKIMNNETYDEGILMEQNFVMDGKIKKIQFENSVPYGFLKLSSKRIKFCCLHFQGPTKFYMKYFSRGSFGAVDKFTAECLMWFRDNVGSKLSGELRAFGKKLLVKFGI